MAKLVAKFPGLSKQLLGLIADKLAANVTEESQIEDTITGLDNSPIPIQDYAKFLQQESDRRVTDARRSWEQEQQTNEEDDDELDEENQPTKTDIKGKKGKGGTNSAIAQLTSVVQKLSTEITNMKSGAQKQTLSEKLNAQLAEKKIPASFYKGRTVEKEEDLETVAAEIEADYNTVKQGWANETLGSGGIPGGGNVNTSAADADIKAWGEASKPATK